MCGAALWRLAACVVDRRRRAPHTEAEMGNRSVRWALLALLLVVGFVALRPAIEYRFYSATTSRQFGWTAARLRRPPDRREHRDLLAVGIERRHRLCDSRRHREPRGA